MCVCVFFVWFVFVLLTPQRVQPKLTLLQRKQRVHEFDDEIRRDNAVAVARKRAREAQLEQQLLREAEALAAQSGRSAGTDQPPHTHGAKENTSPNGRGRRAGPGSAPVTLRPRKALAANSSGPNEGDAAGEGARKPRKLTVPPVPRLSAKARAQRSGSDAAPVARPALRRRGKGAVGSADGDDSDDGGSIDAAAVLGAPPSAPAAGGGDGDDDDDDDDGYSDEFESAPGADDGDAKSNGAARSHSTGPRRRPRRNGPLKLVEETPEEKEARILAAAKAKARAERERRKPQVAAFRRKQKERLRQKQEAEKAAKLKAEQDRKRALDHLAEYRRKERRRDSGRRHVKVREPWHDIVPEPTAGAELEPAVGASPPRPQHHQHQSNVSPRRSPDAPAVAPSQASASPQATQRGGRSRSSAPHTRTAAKKRRRPVDRARSGGRGGGRDAVAPSEAEKRQQRLQRQAEARAAAKDRFVKRKRLAQRMKRRQKLQAAAASKAVEAQPPQAPDTAQGQDQGHGSGVATTSRTRDPFVGMADALAQEGEDADFLNREFERQQEGNADATPAAATPPPAAPAASPSPDARGDARAASDASSGASPHSGTASAASSLGEDERAAAVAAAELAAEEAARLNRTAVLLAQVRQLQSHAARQASDHQPPAHDGNADRDRGDGNEPATPAVHDSGANADADADMGVGVGRESQPAPASPKPTAHQAVGPDAWLGLAAEIEAEMQAPPAQPRNATATEDADKPTAEDEPLPGWQPPSRKLLDADAPAPARLSRKLKRPASGRRGAGTTDGSRRSLAPPRATAGAAAAQPAPSKRRRRGPSGAGKGQSPLRRKKSRRAGKKAVPPGQQPLWKRFLNLEPSPTGQGSQRRRQPAPSGRGRQPVVTDDDGWCLPPGGAPAYVRTSVDNLPMRPPQSLQQQAPLRGALPTLVQPQAGAAPARSEDDLRDPCDPTSVLDLAARRLAGHDDGDDGDVVMQAQSPPRRTPPTTRGVDAAVNTAPVDVADEPVDGDGAGVDAAVVTALRSQCRGMVAEGIASFRTVFDLIDMDDDGSVTEEELHQALVNLDIRPTPLESRALFQTLDTDKDGMVTIDEFMAFCKPEDGAAGPAPSTAAPTGVSEEAKGVEDAGDDDDDEYGSDGFDVDDDVVASTGDGVDAAPSLPSHPPPPAPTQHTPRVPMAEEPLPMRGASGGRLSPNSLRTLPLPRECCRCVVGARCAHPVLPASLLVASA